MNVERSDTLDGTTYIMTESHTYSKILQRLREIEPRAVPIKHVGTQKTIATGYKVPSNTASLEDILDFLRSTHI